MALQGFLFTGPEVAARRLAEHPRIRKVSANRPVELKAQTEPSGGWSGWHPMFTLVPVKVLDLTEDVIGRHRPLAVKVQFLVEEMFPTAQ